jgi:DNA-binding LytR/AlgR family response regulator
MSGFEVIQNLRRAPPPIIVIVTAFDEHAIRAFEAGAVDYLLKSVKAVRLRKAVDRCTACNGGQPKRRTIWRGWLQRR